MGLASMTVEAGLRARGLSAVAVIPARDEEATVGTVVGPLVHHLVQSGMLAEVVVVDDGSTDRTGARARAAGARVVRAADMLAGHGGSGKGGAMWRGLAATTADLVVYLDADLVDLDPDTVPRLLQPLVEDPTASLVKGTWRRPLGDDPDGGGRVTELMARPLLARFFPELSFVRQPSPASTPAPACSSSASPTWPGGGSTSASSSTPPRWSAPPPSARSTSAPATTATTSWPSWPCPPPPCSWPSSTGPA